MQRLKWLILGVLVILALFGAVVSAQSGDALVRFVHVVPGAQAIDIYVDGELTVMGLDYGQGTDYLTIPGGTHLVAVTQTGLTTTLWEQEINPAADTASTLVASSIDQLVFTVYADSLAAVDLGKARVTVIHAIAEGPTVDVLIAGNRSVFPDLQYNAPTGSIDLDLSVEYLMAVVPAGEDATNAIIPEEALPLTSGALFTYIIYGTESRPEKLLLATPVASSEDAGFVRLAHAMPDAPEVDVFFNNVRVATRLPFGATTQYIAAPADTTYDVSVRVSGSGDDVAGANLTLEAGNRLTAVVAGSLDTPTLAGLSDELGELDSDRAILSVINVLPNSTDAVVSLADGTELIGGLTFPDTGTTSFEPSAEAASINVTVDSEEFTLELPEMPFHAGVYYSLVLIAGEESAEAIMLDPVSIAQGIGSAPGDDTLGQVAQVPTATPTAVAAQAGAEPTQSAEVVAETPMTPAAAAPGSTSNVTGTVVGLEPTANLRLRQYPNTGATTLYLAPVGTVLIVNGREGPEFFPEGVATPTLAPETTPFVDPATLLTGGDLAPATTWLNVSYSTSDGGTITAWAIANFLDVRGRDGQSQRLASLPLIPRNRPGEATNTSLTPPPNTQDRVTVIVTGINQGANLNLRRTPDTTGEVLAPVPAGTVLDFLGVNEARTWLFVRYISLDGMNYTGWVSTSFVQLNLNDQPTTLDVLQARSLLVITPNETRGTAEAGAPPVVAATRDPLRNVVVAEVTGVNAGANLNLRRTPNVQGEVLLPIPSGSILLVLGRTESSEWLEVTYENQTGWVSSQYVSLSYNGVPVDINTVQITSLRLTASPTGAPTATPGA